MRTLKFVVSGQSIDKDPACDFSRIVRGSKGYLEAQFEFDEEWDGFLKIAEFTNYDTPYNVPIKNGCCRVPDEVTDHRCWKVRVLGKRGNMRLNTGKISVRQEE